MLSSRRQGDTIEDEEQVMEECTLTVTLSCSHSHLSHSDKYPAVPLGCYRDAKIQSWSSASDFGLIVTKGLRGNGR